jgi:ankyrin repeat protein
VGRDLIEAARRGDVAEIGRLLAQGANVDARDGTNRTPLHHATEGNHIAAAVALIEAGADVNASDGASIDHIPYLMAGRGVAVVDGRLVENLHVENAKRLLAQSKAIAEMHGNA